MSKPIKIEQGVKYRDADKMALIPVRNVAQEEAPKEVLRKPSWMKIKLPSDSKRIQEIKSALVLVAAHFVMLLMVVHYLPMQKSQVI